MPLSIPAFDQYQSPMFPLRGLWNSVPPEGDKFCNAEIDWLVTTKSTAVQFSLSGNSPVSLSQIAALAVDNSRSGADCSFIFPDSGWQLVVPAHNQLVAPVFTNALMFYASAPGAVVGDITLLQIFNSVPPPVPIAPSLQQNRAGVTGIPLQTNGSTVIVPVNVTGTLNSGNVSVSARPAAVAAGVTLTLIDGLGKVVWQTQITMAASAPPQDFDFPLNGLSVRFVNGLSLQISSSNYAGDWVVVNVYYSIP
jgi:hypothetical protein